MGSRVSRGSEGGPSLKRQGGVGVGRAEQRRRITQPSDLAPGILFPLMCKQAGLPVPVAEFRFHPVRKWRLDHAFVEAKLGLEIDGGVWLPKSGHNTGYGIIRDQEKLNALTVLGWRLLRVLPKHLCTQATLDLIREALSV